MPCYPIHDAQGKPFGIICGKLGKRCSGCGGLAGLLCDFPVGTSATCDKPICNRCANHLGPDVHYCRAHARMCIGVVGKAEVLPKPSVDQRLTLRGRTYRVTQVAGEIAYLQPAGMDWDRALPLHRLQVLMLEAGY